MKILLISRCPPFPLHYGDRLIPYHLGRELSQRGDEIDLLAFYNRDEDPTQVGYYADWFRSVDLVRETPRTALAYLARLMGLQRFFPRQASGSWSPEMWHVIRNKMHHYHYDVIQLFGGIQVYEFRNLVRALPTVIVPYESYSLFTKRANAQATTVTAKLRTWIEWQAAQAYERHMFEGYSRVVVLSEADAEALQQTQPKTRKLPIEVIPNGIDLEYFDPSFMQIESAGNAPPTIIFFGNLEYAPNADGARWLLDEILPLIRAELPTVQVLLVGNNPPADLLARATDSIIVTGRVPDVRPYLQQAQLFLCCLRFGAGIKNKVLEALAMQLPVVATPLSLEGIAVEVGEQALVGQTAVELAHATITLLRDRDRCQRMGVAGRRLIERRYAWRSIAERYHAIYQSIQPTK